MIARAGRDCGSVPSGSRARCEIGEMEPGCVVGVQAQKVPVVVRLKEREIAVGEMVHHLFRPAAEIREKQILRGVPDWTQETTNP